jgi:hypothetical protein
MLAASSKVLDATLAARRTRSTLRAAERRSAKL